MQRLPVLPLQIEQHLDDLHCDGKGKSDDKEVPPGKRNVLIHNVSRPREYQRNPGKKVPKGTLIHPCLPEKQNHMKGNNHTHKVKGKGCDQTVTALYHRCTFREF